MLRPTGLNNLAVLLRKRGRLDEAVPLLEEAVSVYAEINAPDPLVATTRFNLAAVEYVRGHLD